MIFSLWPLSVVKSKPQDLWYLSLIFSLTRILIGFSIGGLWPTVSVWGLENLTYKDLSEDMKKFTADFKEQKFSKHIRKNLSSGGFMQLGFHTGWFVSAITIVVCKTSNEISQFFFLTLLGGILSSILVIYCIFCLNNSDMLKKKERVIEEIG